MPRKERPAAADAAPRRRGRRPGKTFTEAEAKVLRDFVSGFGRVEDFAAEIGRTPQHTSAVLNRRAPVSQATWHRMLRLMRDHSFMSLAMLDALGTPETQDEIRAVRSVERSDFTPAGRGYATGATVA